MTTDRSHIRLKWKCRRGTLEMDKILNDFVDHHYSNCTDEEKQAFESLLETPDPILWDWIITGQVADQPYQGIVDLIREKSLHP